VLVSLLIGLVSAAVAALLVTTLALIVYRPEGLGWRGVTAFFPNVLRLLRGVHSDPEIPRSVRTRIWIAIAYNIQPINLIPDFIPVIGFADNIVVTAWALRSAVRKAGTDVVARHWPGTEEQFALLLQVARLAPPGETTS
jgi:uncharacterized membrane protein YkvA (DUF1232 family)